MRRVAENRTPQPRPPRAGQRPTPRGARRVFWAPLLAAALVLAGAAAVAAVADSPQPHPPPAPPPAPAAPLVEMESDLLLPPEEVGYLAALLAGSAALCVALGLRARIARAQVNARLDLYVGPSLGRVNRRASFRSRTIVPLLTALSPLVAWLAHAADSVMREQQVERIRVYLAIAGLPYSRHVSRFLAAKAGLAVAGGLLAALYQLWAGAPLGMLLLLTAIGALVGFYLPGMWLGRRMARRRQEVLKALPDALDLLTISVSGGLGFDGAMLEVVQRWDNALSEEFSAVLRDQKLGTSRREALRAFAQRTGVEEVASFVAAVLQADELGTPMKEVLQIQAEQMRMQRRHRAEERARKATIKMLFPMVLFIFPALFVVILGPSIPSLKAFFGR